MIAADSPANGTFFLLPKWDQVTIAYMRVISRARLREFWNKHTASEDALKAWYAEAETSHWRAPSDIKAEYPSDSFIAGNRVVFNIRGNRYRLVVAIKYEFEIVYIRFVGKHADYEKIDAAKV